MLPHTRRFQRNKQNLKKIRKPLYAGYRRAIFFEKRALIRAPKPDTVQKWRGNTIPSTSTLAPHQNGGIEINRVNEQSRSAILRSGHFPNLGSATLVRAVANRDALPPKKWKARVGRIYPHRPCLGGLSADARLASSGAITTPSVWRRRSLAVAALSPPFGLRPAQVGDLFFLYQQAKNNLTTEPPVQPRKQNN